MRNISNLKMSLIAKSCDTKNKIPHKVIHNGKLQQWVGIGWVDEGIAKKKDYDLYPVVGGKNK